MLLASSRLLLIVKLGRIVRPCQHTNRLKILSRACPLFLFAFALSTGNSLAQSKDDARQELIRRGITVSEKSFIEAIESGQSEAVTLFIQSGMDPNKRTPSGLPLHYACSGGKRQIAEILISNGAGYAGERDTCLHAAAYCGLAELVSKLLSMGANINSTTADGWTPLHLALHFRHKEIAEFLVSRGADINRQNGDGQTPLMLVADDKTFVELLLAHGADTNRSDKNGRTALLISLQSPSFIQSSRFLMTQGARLDAKTTEGWTALHVALLGRNEEMARLLLLKGADVNSKTVDGWMPLHLAASAGYTTIVGDLISKGADVNAMKGGWTPLSFAIDRNHFGTAAVLIANGGKQ